MQNEDDRDGPVALITGAMGQDGTYLAERLVGMGWNTHGIARRNTNASHGTAISGARVHTLDLTDGVATRNLILALQPDFVFHLAGISSVWQSWQNPELTARVNGLSIVPIVDGCLAVQQSANKSVVLVNASSAEIFSGTNTSPQNEATPISPTSPYGASKAFAHNMVQMYRERHLIGSNAILYNHESPRRPDTFVTRKIVKAAVAIAQGRQPYLELGNVTAVRDWGWAPDFVDAMVRIAKLGQPDDFVVATGESATVADFARLAFEEVGLQNWTEYVRTSEAFKRPGDAAVLVGDATRASERLGWQPTVSLREIIHEMVKAEIGDRA
ncbi:GDP-mannose 4,6-dehydratase [Rhodococcoides kroppenstedtii]|uniref:GDP-mannose 4,6-dehydratase n=1 Tax=Rhodococcoides kroppenstedtii TaxID=293050 RepID=UPI00364146AE